MKRLFLLITLLAILLAVGLVFAQAPDAGFAGIQTIGQPRPRGMQYDPNFDRLVWVDALGRLEIADATTFEVQHTLYNSGFYNAYEFSHDGRYLALAIDIRFEIYDTATGEKLLTFEPDGALRAEGPLYWSPDDTLLGVNLQVRAPQAIRRSENDTTNLPYVWDIAAEFGERRTILPGARAIPFFDYRNGFVYGANNKAVVGLPERLQILDIASDGVEVIGEIASSRFEQDPIFVWTSLRDDLMYIRADGGSSRLEQLDTETGNLVTIPVGSDIGAYSFDNLDGLQLSQFSSMIGEPLATQENSLLRFLLGTDYRAQFGYHPITVTLVDYLEPATPDAGNQVAILLYIFDETRGQGRFDLVDFYPASGFSLSEDGNQIAIRRDSSDSRIDIFELNTGNLIQTFLPTMPDVAREGVFSFNQSGDTIISDFQRFDVTSGEITFENLHYNNGFDRFFWDESNERLVTVPGNRWWVWDIFTGEVVRQETLSLGETIIGTANDGERYLISVIEEQSEAQIESGVSNIYEMVEVGMDDRVRVHFADLPEVTIENVIFSPNGENYLVIYSVNNLGQHAPGNEIMLYNLDAGALWHIAGDDLPDMTARQYGWINETTVYIYSEEGTASPERIYGVDYHGSGVPQCLVDAFPERIGEWSLIWERLSYRLSADDLNLLATASCDLLPSDAEVVIDFIFPTATPTRLPVTATPSTIAGVPTCLTNRFASEARDYAVIWQELIAGRSEAEIEELEILLCENLGGGSSSDGEAPLVTNNVEVMTIDLLTGRREVGAYIPLEPEEFEPNMELVNQAFRRQFGFTPEGELSVDLNLYAVRTQRNQVNIYRLLTPYETYAANATATVAVVEEQEEEETFLSLRPTATQGFSFLGEPRPTLTPTITPTAPVRPQGESIHSQDGEVERICPYTERFTVDNPAPDFAATGRIIALSFTEFYSDLEPTPIPAEGETVQQFQFPLNTSRWMLDVSNGDWTLNDNLPLCYVTNTCNFSFDGRWMYYQTNAAELIVSHPDGSQAQILFYPEQINTTQSFRWRGNFLEYDLTIPPSAENRNTTTQLQRYDPETGITMDVEPYPRMDNYNQLPTSVLSTQPGESNRYQVAGLDFTSSEGSGRRYFIYDRQDEEYRYFGRVSDYLDNGEMNFRWHPSGDSLYYSYPDDNQMYAFSPETESFMQSGNIPGGIWSRDAHAIVYDYFTPGDEREDLIEAGEPVPNIEIWNRESGLRRQYCVPGFEESGIQADYLWSPDSRYLAFRTVLREESQFENAPARSFVLDTETGSVTEISTLAGTLTIWIEEVYQ